MDGSKQCTTHFFCNYFPRTSRKQPVWSSYGVVTSKGVFYSHRNNKVLLHLRGSSFRPTLSPPLLLISASRQFSLPEFNPNVNHIYLYIQRACVHKRYRYRYLDGRGNGYLWQIEAGRGVDFHRKIRCRIIQARHHTAVHCCNGTGWVGSQSNPELTKI